MSPPHAGLLQGLDDHSSKENYGQFSFDNLATDPNHLGLSPKQESENLKTGRQGGGTEESMPTMPEEPMTILTISDLPAPALSQKAVSL